MSVYRTIGPLVLYKSGVQGGIRICFPDVFPGGIWVGEDLRCNCQLAVCPNMTEKLLTGVLSSKQRCYISYPVVFPALKKDPDFVGSTPGGSGKEKMRTRLSTGSIHMNGHTTVSAYKDKLDMEHIMKQIAKCK